jgi:hypothetical protein
MPDSLTSVKISRSSSSRSSNRSKTRLSKSKTHTSQKGNLEVVNINEEPVSSTPDDASSDATPPPKKKGVSQTKKPILSDTKGIKNLPKRELFMRYDFKLFVRQTEPSERSDEAMQETAILSRWKSCKKWIRRSTLPVARER